MPYKLVFSNSPIVYFDLPVSSTHELIRGASANHPILSQSRLCSMFESFHPRSLPSLPISTDAHFSTRNSNTEHLLIPSFHTKIRELKWALYANYLLYHSHSSVSWVAHPPSFSAPLVLLTEPPSLAWVSWHQVLCDLIL